MIITRLEFGKLGNNKEAVVTAEETMVYLRS